MILIGLCSYLIREVRLKEDMLVGHYHQTTDTIHFLLLLTYLSIDCICCNLT